MLDTPTSEIPTAMLDVAAKAILEVAVLVARIAELETQYGDARKLLAVRMARIAELETELAKLSLLEAAQENLRESWARIRQLESELKTIARIGADDVPGSE